MKKLAILFMLACAACTTRAGDPPGAVAGQPSKPAAPVAATRPDTLGQIRSLIGTAACSSDNQCRIVPIGARPCGGPSSYLAWSSASTDAAQLQALADRYKAEQQASNEASGRISTCIAIAPPAVACRAGTCQLTDALATQ
ncbi:hypothetical protein [Massilia sp. SYSU DXS3249]